jgi:hypothetical protein
MTQRSELSVSDPVMLAVLAWTERLALKADCDLILDSGTLLGLVRDGAVVHGDTEIDLSLRDERAIPRLLDALRPLRPKVWHFAGEPYRLEIAADGDGSPPLPAEIKFFVRTADAYTCPAIGWASPGGQKRRSSGLRALLRPAWRKLLERGDAAYFPLSRMARVDRWVIPSGYFDETEALAGYERAVLPAGAEAYLAFRYGPGWRTPSSDWITWRDDGGYQPSSADMRQARRGSPHWDSPQA